MTGMLALPSSRWELASFLTDFFWDPGCWQLLAHMVLIWATEETITLSNPPFLQQRKVWSESNMCQSLQSCPCLQDRVRGCRLRPVTVAWEARVKMTVASKTQGMAGEKSFQRNKEYIFKKKWRWLRIKGFNQVEPRLNEGFFGGGGGGR